MGQCGSARQTPPPYPAKKDSQNSNRRLRLGPTYGLPGLCQGCSRGILAVRRLGSTIRCPIQKRWCPRKLSSQRHTKENWDGSCLEADCSKDVLLSDCQAVRLTTLDRSALGGGMSKELSSWQGWPASLMPSYCAQAFF